MRKRYNPNPRHLNVGDCTVRAISKALGQDWDTTYVGMALEGFLLCNMPSVNYIWSSYLRRKGFIRHRLPDWCPDCYTVADFAADHPRGTYVLALSNHVVCVCNGDWYDTWPSGDEVILYYFQKSESANS